MGWLLAGIAVAVLSLVVLALVLLSLWRRTKALMAEVSKAGEAVAAGTEALAQVQSPAPRTPGTPSVDRSATPAGPRTFGTRRPRGVA